MQIFQMEDIKRLKRFTRQTGFTYCLGYLRNNFYISIGGKICPAVKKEKSGKSIIIKERKKEELTDIRKNNNCLGWRIFV